MLRGIDVAFEKYRSRKHKTQRVNALAFCAQAVLAEAQLTNTVTTAVPVAREAAFPENDVQRFMLANAGALRGKKDPEYDAVAGKLETLAVGNCGDLERLEQQLSVLEQRAIAIARSRVSDDAALETKRELEAQLRPYRGKMTAPQLTMLEHQYLERKILEDGGLPRLSLFYLRA